MTGRAEGADRTAVRLAALLADVSTEAIGAAGGHVGGVHLRSATPGLLRLATLAGLPGRLFQPWWRLHVDARSPVTDTHRLGVPVILPNATETMRRYPQFAAALPFQFGSLHVPVVGASATYGVLTVLRPSAPDASAVEAAADRLGRLAGDLGAALAARERRGVEVVWDGEPMCLRPPATRAFEGRVGQFSWDPATDAVTSDDRCGALLGTTGATCPATGQALAGAVTADDGHHVLTALRDTAAGRPPALPLPVRTGDGALRLIELWSSPAAAPPGIRQVSGTIRDPGPGPLGDAAADLLPDGVFCLDRLGLVVYANPRAAQLLGPSRHALVGRPLWEVVPWLDQPICEDHLRAALLAPDPVHFHVRRPPADSRAPSPERRESHWLALSVHPGPDLLTCTVRPADHVAGTSSELDAVPTPPRIADTTALTPAARVSAVAGAPAPGADSAAHLYRPIVLAIALSEAVTARQVSAVVMQELLPAFGGNRLAIYLLQERHLYLAWETGFPKGFLVPFEGVGLDVHLPGVETLTTGRPLFFDSMAQLAATYPGVPLDAAEGSRAFLPLIASGRPVGSCILGFDRPHSFSGDERTVLTALAGLIAHAMEKAQRYDTESALARGLQQALLPRLLPEHPEVETAGCYLPGTEGMEVGGDWYDVLATGDGLALVIGDVQGHGVQAAATMGQLRSAVRAFTLGDHPPDEVMSGTNRLLIDLDPGQFASCCYLRLDPATGVVRVARAGHPLPLLRTRDGRTEVCDVAGGVLLGVDRLAHYPVTELRMERGAVLALYTDGLVERLGLDIDLGVEALRVALAEAGAMAARVDGQSLTSVADRLTATARHTADRPDDIALLLAMRRPAPRPVN
ncbi:SpoIIE family protein phosphatase [Streptomyces sp. NPDC014864]|uniref:SpoIIE family protein phosphatase n=1 Tax=Streptomyces sp. NPDC014864 TaxID=3364924 RepID=UPI0036FA149B